jgi:hypothetical protein
MKLKFFLNKQGKKEYTLKEKVNEQKTKDAHYKFIKVRDAPKSDGNFFKKN